jgi:hypothetical protein
MLPPPPPFTTPLNVDVNVNVGDVNVVEDV